MGRLTGLRVKLVIHAEVGEGKGEMDMRFGQKSQQFVPILGRSSRTCAGGTFWASGTVPGSRRLQLRACDPLTSIKGWLKCVALLGTELRCRVCVCWRSYASGSRRIWSGYFGHKGDAGNARSYGNNGTGRNGCICSATITRWDDTAAERACRYKTGAEYHEGKEEV